MSLPTDAASRVTPDAPQLRARAGTAVGKPWEIPTLIAATTGARRGEVLGLRWRDVELDRGRVRIETLQRIDGELVFVPPKTERARREIRSRRSTSALDRRP